MKYVCVTADVWTAKSGTFFGSTLHWLDPVSMHRKSAPFFRHQLNLQQDPDEIAELLTTSCEKYRIKQKIVAIVAKNGWNYGNAFAEMGVLTGEKVDICEFHEINLDWTLQSHSECVIHTLSKITTADAANALTDAAYRGIHTSVFEKLTLLWNKSLEYSVEFGDVTRPTDGRCNSLYDSLHFITTKGIDAINAMNTQLNVPTLTQCDYKFLVEFVHITKPISGAIDHLLKSNCHFAAFLPTIYTIDHAFQKLLTQEFEYCRPLLQSVHSGFMRRFKYCFDLKGDRCKSAVLATCTHPFFKTRWLPPNHGMDKCIAEIVTNAVKEELQSGEGEGLNCKKIQHLIDIYL